MSSMFLEESVTIRPGVFLSLNAFGTLSEPKIAAWIEFSNFTTENKVDGWELPRNITFEWTTGEIPLMPVISKGEYRAEYLSNINRKVAPGLQEKVMQHLREIIAEAKSDQALNARINSFLVERQKTTLRDDLRFHQKVFERTENQIEDLKAEQVTRSQKIESLRERLEALTPSPTPEAGAHA